LQPLVQLDEQGPGAGVPSCLPLIRWSPTDLALYVVERADPVQGLLRDGRSRCLVDVVELASNVSPTGGLHDSSGLVESIEAGVAIGLQDAAEALQVLGRMRRLAIGRVTEPHRRRHRIRCRTIVA